MLASILGAAAQNHEKICLDDDAEDDQRIKSCTAAIEAKPKQDLAAEYLFARGGLYRRDGQFDLAIRDYDEVVRIVPDGYGAIHNRGLAYRMRGEKGGSNANKDFQAAIRNFNQAIKISPKFSQAYFARGVTYSNMRDFVSAVQSFDGAIRIEPKNATFLHNRCAAKIASGQSKSAVPDCSFVIKASGTWRYAAYTMRGYAFINLKKYDDAISDFDRALKFNPRDDTALYGRGLAKIAKGDKAGGEVDVAAAKKRDSGVESEMADYLIE
jgi:tetratricopeptide (TPR) repeat protein